MFEDYPDIVITEELQEMLRIGRESAYNLVNSGKIKAVRVGNGWRIAKETIIEFVQANEMHK